MTTIMGIRLSNRNNTATTFQETLTKFGCSIKTRIGLHEVSDGVCSPQGIILLEVIDDSIVGEFEKELCKIEGIEIQLMKFPQK